MLDMNDILFIVIFIYLGQCSLIFKLCYFNVIRVLQFPNSIYKVNVNTYSSAPICIILLLKSMHQIIFKLIYNIYLDGQDRYLT
jgi:hypothetical protein